MTNLRPPTDETRAEIMRVEERRQRALIAGDLPALDDLFDDTLLHVHAPGLIHRKAQLLEHVATRQAYLEITRGELDIRVADGIAIVTGAIVNRMRAPGGGERTLEGVATQVLAHGERGWRFVSFQMTPSGEEVWPALPSEAAHDDAPAAQERSMST
ncbi:nuclear transport factor 2 family protein [Microbacterium karelineae]|uniref:nuclear transport factor 2 family protein n=1 Tax=Microbacterium karelineae TaxID=2654283 RepID=UPI0012EA9004|nr:nuclear transport factor 2 family protein [Microbacterium karelineae]